MELLFTLRLRRLELNLIQLGAVVACCPWRAALHLLASASQLHLQPDVITYNGALHRCGLPVARKLLAHMGTEGLEASLVSFNSLISCASKWTEAITLRLGS